MVAFFLCLATPAIQDIVEDVTSAILDAPCCADGCDESGQPCSQQCVHCVCGARLAVTATDVGVALPAFTGAGLEGAWELHAVALHGHLDPPFRPPAS